MLARNGEQSVGSLSHWQPAAQSTVLTAEEIQNTGLVACPPEQRFLGHRSHKKHSGGTESAHTTFETQCRPT